MTTLLQKIKNAFGFYPKASYYKIEENTAEPVKVSYTPEEPAVDNKDDSIDLAAMTKTELTLFARERGLAVTAKMKKQEIINLINETL